jgi:hypothetical protein
MFMLLGFEVLYAAGVPTAELRGIEGGAGGAIDKHDAAMRE